MNMKQIKFITTAAIIAAIYATLTIMLAPISYHAVQVRISEVLTILPAITPAGVPGLFIGCIVANLFTGNIFDIIFGSLATLVAAVLTYYLRKNRWLIPLPPVLVNAVVVGIIITYAYENAPKLLWLNMLTVGVGQFIACYIIGLPLYSLLKKNKDRLGL